MEPVLVAAVIESELGHPPEQLFAEFSPEPIAAASIGRVHAACLHEVAVKVQYPGVAAAIGDDVAKTELLCTFVKIAKGVVPQLRNVDVRAVADEVAERIGEELSANPGVHPAEVRVLWRVVGQSRLGEPDGEQAGMDAADADAVSARLEGQALGELDDLGAETSPH